MSGRLCSESSPDYGIHSWVLLTETEVNLGQQVFDLAHGLDQATSDEGISGRRARIESTSGARRWPQHFEGVGNGALQLVGNAVHGRGPEEKFSE